MTGILLEAEISPQQQHQFEMRYHAATGNFISPGQPVEYQSQNNKWGAELRIYFNDPELAGKFREKGFHVEFHSQAYRSDKFIYRINNNDLWWELIEEHGLRLGMN